MLFSGAREYERVFPDLRMVLAGAVGLAVFLAVALGATAALDPHVWPSVVVGVPVGLAAGALATGLTWRLLGPPGDAGGE